MKKVVLLGFKGDCCGRHYNKTLIEMVLREEIELICVDYGEPENVRGVPSLKEMISLINQKKAEYLDLQRSEDKKKYQELKDIDFVFVVTWDKTHCQIAQDFLGRTKAILIDKPLDAFLRNVDRFLGDVPQNVVFGFDHYLAKFYPFLTKINEHIERIGAPEAIEFRLLEPIAIPTHRIVALDRGMIYDLFSHGLAVIGGVMSRQTNPDPNLLRKFEIEKVRAAKYLGVPIRGDTYAYVKIKQPFEIQARVGKAVGWEPDKILKVQCSKGEVFADIQNFKFSIFDLAGNKVEEGNLFPDYAEKFLKTLIDKGVSLQTPGVMSFEAAKEILFILDETEHRVPPGELPGYPPGSTIEEIEDLIDKKKEELI